MLDKVSDQIATQRREIGNLQRDERRLAELVDRLSKIIATRAPKRGKSPRSATARGAHGGAAAAQQAAQVKPREQVARRPGDKPRGRHDRSPRRPLVSASRDDPGAGGARARLRRRSPGNLARMKGQLRLPTRGSISNRFGTPRQEGSTWKGLFILASAGSEVRSIAGGRVVFAEWMRGFRQFADH
jgi:septal ring factor EnvC (AmiA/AmiB activator)